MNRTDFSGDSGAVIVSSAAGPCAGCGYTVRDENVIRAADLAATTGDADIINLSVNMDSATGRDEARAYFDSIGGGETFRTVVASSGNYNTGFDPGWLVTSPGTSWNVLTVGGMNDNNNTLWYDASCPCGAKYQDDLTAPYNPDHDFNKPNIPLRPSASRLRTASLLQARASQRRSSRGSPRSRLRGTPSSPIGQSR